MKKKRKLIIVLDNDATRQTLMRNQGQSHVSDKQTALEDRYYNNQSFQEEYPVNDPEVNHAATKIQAKFRGHKARQNVEKMKQDTKVIDTDQQELGYGRESTGTPSEHRLALSSDDEPIHSPIPSERLEQEQPKEVTPKRKPPTPQPDEVVEELELTPEELEEQDRAARSIQARFRGFKSRQNAPTDQPSAGQTPDNVSHSSHQGHPHDPLEKRDSDDPDRPRLEREPTQLSEDFERHTHVPRDDDFQREQLEDDIDIDMNDPQLEKAATRIQASFRGYKTRKELGPTGQPSIDHPSSTEHEKNIISTSAEGNKDPENEEYDTNAVVKIQAAYRGYRTRKDMDK